MVGQRTQNTVNCAGWLVPFAHPSTTWPAPASRLKGSRKAPVPQAVYCAEEPITSSKFSEELERRPLPPGVHSKLGQTGLAPSSLSNNKPFSLGERHESARPGPFQQPRQLPAGQSISNSQLVWAPQVVWTNPGTSPCKNQKGTHVCVENEVISPLVASFHSKEQALFLSKLGCPWFGRWKMMWSYGNDLLREMNPSSVQVVWLPFQSTSVSCLLSKIGFCSQGKIVIISISNCIRCRR